MSILDSDAISKAYFFPQLFSCPDAIEIEVEGASLSCLYRVDDLEQPTLVHFHGNGEAVQDYVVMRYPKMIHKVFPDVVCNCSDLDDDRLAQDYSVITPNPLSDEGAR